MALTIAAMLAVPIGNAGAAPREALGSITDGSLGIRLVDVPLAAEGDPRAKLYIVDHLPPDSIIHRRIEVANATDSVERVALYPAAATIEKGSFLGAEGHTANELSTWVSVRPRSVEVAAGGRVMANVRIEVPADAAPGERYGVVWAEARSVVPDGSGVVQVNRVGIRIYLSVGPGGEPAADFEIRSLTAARSPEGDPIVLATVRNTGGRALDMNGTLQLLDGPGGLNAGPFPAVLGTTLGVGETEPVTITMDEQVPAGPWDARIALSSGFLERKARATITFPDAGVSEAVAASSIRPWWIFPLIAAGAAAAMIGIATLILRRRRPGLVRTRLARA